MTGQWMRREISEQPDRWLDLIESQRGAITAAADRINAGPEVLLRTIARGSSANAGAYFAYVAAQEWGRLVVEARPAAVTVLNQPSLGPRSANIVLSQSGGSPDLRAVADAARKAGELVIAMTNAPASPLARIADVHIDLSAGTERSVAATKSYTAELIGLFALVRAATGHRWSAIEEAVAGAAAVARRMIPAAEVWARRTAGEWSDVDRALLIGRGPSLASALEGALKLVETSGIAASGWSSAEVMHGPLGQVSAGIPVLTFGSGTDGHDSTIDAARAAQALGARVYAIGAGYPGAQEALPIDGFNGVDRGLVPTVEVIAVQHLALALATSRHRNPDAPVGLAKVTRTT